MAFGPEGASRLFARDRPKIGLPPTSQQFAILVGFDLRRAGFTQERQALIVSRAPMHRGERAAWQNILGCAHAHVPLQIRVGMFASHELRIARITADSPYKDPPISTERPPSDSPQVHRNLQPMTVLRCRNAFQRRRWPLSLLSDYVLP